MSNNKSQDTQTPKNKDVDLISVAKAIAKYHKEIIKPELEKYDTKYAEIIATQEHVWEIFKRYTDIVDRHTDMIAVLMFLLEHPSGYHAYCNSNGLILQCVEGSNLREYRHTDIFHYQKCNHEKVISCKRKNNTFVIRTQVKYRSIFFNTEHWVKGHKYKVIEGCLHCIN